MKKRRNAAKHFQLSALMAAVMLISVFMIGGAGPVWAKSKKKSVNYPVALAHAKNDEKGRYSGASKGAKPGDQRGNEVAVDSYFSYSGWTYVARAKDPVKAKLIAKQAIDGCNNDKIGYGADGLQLYEAAQEVLFQLGKVSQKCNTDCYGFVDACCFSAGLQTSPIGMRKGKEYDEGYNPYHEYEFFWDKAHRKSAKLLKVGDILVRQGKNHVAILVKNSKR